MHRRTGGACSASGGEAVCSGVTHRFGRGEALMRFDPGDGQVVMPADSGEKAPDSLNEGLVAARFDGVVPEEADAVLTVCKEVDALPGHSGGGSVPAVNPLKSMVNCAYLPCIVRGTRSTNPFRIRAVGDHRAPEGSGGVLKCGDKDPPSGRGSLASQIAPIGGTRVREKSSMTASMPQKSQWEGGRRPES